MIATKFEPHDNWLPPCYYVPRELERALIEAGVPASLWNRADLPSLRNLSKEEICQLVRERGEKLGKLDLLDPSYFFNFNNTLIRAFLKIFMFEDNGGEEDKNDDFRVLRLHFLCRAKKISEVFFYEQFSRILYF